MGVYALTGGLSFLGHVFSVLWRLVELLVVLGVLNSIQSNQTAGIVAVLGIIYTTVRSLGIGLSHQLFFMAVGLDVEFKTLYEKLGHPPPPKDENLETIIRRTHTKMWINALAMTAVYFVCLYFAFTKLSH